MSAWLWWLLLAGAFAIAELFTMSFVLIMIAGGAASASVTAALGGPVWLQFVVLGVVSTALIAGVRPIAREHMFHGPTPRSGSDRLIGSRAVVLSRVDEHDGRVRLNGGEWSARTGSRHAAFDAGTAVIVVAIDGATAVIAADPNYPDPAPVDPGESRRNS